MNIDLGNKSSDESRIYLEKLIRNTYIRDLQFKISRNGYSSRPKPFEYALKSIVDKFLDEY